MLLETYWFLPWCRADNRTLNVTHAVAGQLWQRKSMCPGWVYLSCLFTSYGSVVVALCVPPHPPWRGTWGGELETQGNGKRNLLCLGAQFPWAALTVFQSGVRRSIPCTAATIFVSHSTEKVLAFGAHSVHFYLLLNVTEAQVIKTVCVCSRRYKAPVAKRIILKYCSTVTQVTLKMTIGVDRVFLF